MLEHFSIEDNITKGPETIYKYNNVKNKRN